MTSSESPTLRMGAAEKRRQKIIARGKSRLEGITNLTLNDPVEPLEEHSDISVSTNGVQDRSIANVEEAANFSVAPKTASTSLRTVPSGLCVSQADESTSKRKLGTAAGDGWIKYEVEEEEQICTKQSYSQEEMSKRIASAVNRSKVIRAMIIISATLFLGVYKHSISIRFPSAKEIGVQRHKMINTCTGLLPRNFGRNLFDFFAPCIGDIHTYLVLELRFQSGESRKITWLENILLYRPFLLVSAASTAVVFLFLLDSLFFRQNVADVIRKDLTMIERLKKMLPGSVSRILDTVDLAKLALNTILLDAGLFVLTSMMYYLLPLAV